MEYNRIPRLYLLLTCSCVVQESRTQFAVNLTEMITKLLEVSRGAFGSWRESELVWSTRQSDHLAKLVGNKVLLGDATPELYEVTTLNE